MPLICLTIDEVVDQIHNPREAAKDGECRDGARKRMKVEQVAAEQDTRKHEQTLRPLFGAERSEQEAGSRTRRGVLFESSRRRRAIGSGGGRTGRTRHHSAAITRV